MNMSIFKSFFKPKAPVDVVDIELFDTVEDACKKSNLLFYKDVTIYHHTKSLLVPLLLLDPTRGIYIFECKTWSYDILKDATAKRSKDQQQADNTLAFDQIHSIIKTKFNELTHNDGVETFNFLMMENLTTQEYERLNFSLQELLPKDRIIFKDSTQEEIIKKFKNVRVQNHSMPDIAHIMGNLLIQYLVLSDNKEFYMATKQQMEFIDAKVENHQILYGENGSGRTSALLLKTVLYKLRNPDKKVLIISPTTLSCDMLKRKLLDIVEHAIIELDLTSIDIITPIELLNKHLAKYNKPLMDDENIYVEDILMKKKMQIAELIMCDDSDLMPDDFIFYLKHIQKKSNLILITNKTTPETSFVFKETIFQNLDIQFISTNPHAKALQIIAKLLKDNDAKDIVVVSDEVGKKHLDEDLEFFIKDEPILLDSSKNLIEQHLDNILLVTYEKTSAINAKFVIILNVCKTSLNSLVHAIGSAQNSAYILYEEECEQIKNLQEKYGEK